MAHQFVLSVVVVGVCVCWFVHPNNGRVVFLVVFFCDRALVLLLTTIFLFKYVFISCVVMYEFSFKIYIYISYAIDG